MGRKKVHSSSPAKEFGAPPSKRASTVKSDLPLYCGLTLAVSRRRKRERRRSERCRQSAAHLVRLAHTMLLIRHDWYTSTAVDSIERRNHLRMIQEFF